MLRESSVTYASLPQEEGSPQAAFVTTRDMDSPHVRRDCHLAAIITTFVIIIGVSLAVILPLTLRAPDASGRGDESGDLLWSHIDQLGQQLVGKEPIPDEDTGSDGSDGADDPPGTLTDDLDHGAPLPEFPKLTTADASLPANEDLLDHKEDEFDDVRPAATTAAPAPTAYDGQPFPNAEGGTEGGGGDLEGGMPTEMDSETGEGGGAPSSDFMDSAAEGDGMSGSNVDEVDAASGAEGGDSYQDSASKTTLRPVVTAKPTTGHADAGVQEVAVTPSGPKTTLDKDQLLDQIFGTGSPVKPGTIAASSWMNEVIGAQDEVTVTILAVIVAIATAAVLGATVCLVHSRVKARRRRIRIHNVITDLQSRDKIVLMNSDESEEE
ncbi:uncharacterized protein LOC122257571 [Penaeus japonicus]|uniref:uncharacterized protein LOC122257571 n=1 Tax=Penaeus japonicus TaxID=27405 RepID=UPI001C70C282|nr:uncharacterized protein LOC122257571 [Penaeus japonicus]